MKKFVYDGWIEVICGPMFAGKTEKLLSMLDKIKYAKANYVLFKPVLDTRTPGAVASRNSLSQKAIEVSTPQEVISLLNSDEYKDCKVLAFDEMQFFKIEFVDLVSELSQKGYHIIISGLDKNFKGEPFGETIPKLLAIADKVTKLSAACHECGASASFTTRITNDYDNSEIVIGDNKLYQARCYQHFKKS